MTYAILLSSHKLLKVLEITTLLAVLVAFLRPRWGSGFFRRMESDFRHLARNRRHAILAAALFPMIARALLLPWYPPPPPQIHDEFSYLLQGDTFAHGRVANPTPPYWQHFETEYVLLQPSYASQYQPAQGLVLAAGEVVLHHAWFGVWISVGLMCGAICWALGFIFPPTWALFGAILAALQFGIFGLWMNSYFGGAPAAIAGALIVGSLARMKWPEKRRSSSALCALGVLITFASRPLEALIWMGICAVWFFSVFWRERSGLTLARLVLPFAAVFALGVVALMYYNWRITGNPLNPPYLEYQKVYGTPQPYWWQPPVQVNSFDFPELRDNYLNQVHLYENRNSIPAILEGEWKRIVDFWRFFIGPFYTPALLFIFVAWRDKRLRPWLLVSVPFILDKATYHAWFPAQNAPAAVLIVLILVQCWRHMLVWWRERRVGLALSRQLVAACCLTLLLGGIGRAIEPILPSQLRHLPAIWESLYPARRLRDDVTAKLEKMPGKHLVFVKYSADHCFCEEWVFNGADIANQRIVYARPYTPESDEALARYLGDHDVWVIEPDMQPYNLARLDDSQLAKITAPEPSGE